MGVNMVNCIVYKILGKYTMKACNENLPIKSKTGFKPLPQLSACLPLVLTHKIALHLFAKVNSLYIYSHKFVKWGAPDGTSTRDQPFAKRLLYASELRGHPKSTLHTKSLSSIYKLYKSCDRIGAWESVNITSNGYGLLFAIALGLVMGWLLSSALSYQLYGSSCPLGNLL